jgi:hypothetical protein
LRTTNLAPAATAARSPLVPLQQTIGNRAVGRLVQAKLEVGRPGDRFEREADRVAEQVLATHAHAGLGTAPPRIQRLGGQPTGQAGTAPASVDRALASPGRPLDPTLQQDMERRFGHDLSKVRVHSGALAERSARDVAARAYTVGDDIVFGAGALAPRSPEGRRLIAHELTHVVQQSGADGISAGQDRAPSVQRQRAPSAEIERPAEYAFAEGCRLDSSLRQAPATVRVEPNKAKEERGVTHQTATRITPFRMIKAHHRPRRERHLPPDPARHL